MTQLQFGYFWGACLGVLSRTLIAIRKGDAPASKFASAEMRRLCVI